MEFELTAEQRGIQGLTRELAEAEIVAERACVGPRASFSRRALPEARRARADGRVRSRGVRRRGRRLPFLHPRAGGALPGGRGSGGHRRGAHERDDAPDPRIRDRTSSVRASFRRSPAASSSAHSRSPSRARAPTRRRCERLPRFGDDGWRLTGSKQWITNGSRAGTFVLFARSDPETAGARGVSCFILDASHVRVTREEEKLGLNSSTTSDLVLEDAHVDADRLLHDGGRGFRVAMATLDGGRIGIAAQALGIAQAAYDVARSVRAGACAVRTPDRATSRRSSGSSQTWRPRSTQRAS